MGWRMRDRFRGGAPWSVCAVALVSFATLSRSNGMLPSFPPDQLNVAVLVSGLMYIPIALLARMAPTVIAHRAIGAVAAACAISGALAWEAMPADVGAAGGYLVTDALFNVGRAWATILAILSLGASDDGGMVGRACLGVGISYMVCLALAPLMDGSGAWLCCAAVLTLLVGGSRKADALFKRVREMPSTQELEVTNPFSFIPLVSRLYLCILLFEATFGYATVTQIRINDAATMPLVGVALFVLAALSAITRSSSGSSASRRFDEDALFTICILAVMLGFLLAPTTGWLDAFSLFSLTVGSQAFYALMLCVLAVAGARNPIGAILCAAMGSGVSTCSSSIGGMISSWVVDHGTSVDSSIFVTAIFAFVLLAYVLIVMRNYGFARQFSEIAPIDDARCGNSAAATHVVAHSPMAGCPTAVFSASDGIDACLDLFVREYGLTPREREIAALLARGRNGAFIQNSLVISRNTAKTHIRHIYGKLQVHSQQELIDLFEGRRGVR